MLSQVEGLAAAGKTLDDFKVPQLSCRDTGSFWRCLDAQSPRLCCPGRWPKERRKLHPGTADQQQPQADPTAPARAHGDPQGARGANSFAQHTVPVLVEQNERAFADAGEARRAKQQPREAGTSEVSILKSFP